jgi:hypothetical protein
MVGAEPGPLGLFDATTAFRVNPDGRELDLLGVAMGMSSGVPREIVAASAALQPSLHPLLPADISQNTGRGPPRVHPTKSSPKDFGYH